MINVFNIPFRDISRNYPKSKFYKMCILQKRGLAIFGEFPLFQEMFKNQPFIKCYKTCNILTV